MVLFHWSVTQFQSSRPPSRDFVSYDAMPGRLADPTPTTGSSDENSSQGRPRVNTDGPKRLSIFGGKSRNNTITSTASYQSSFSSITYVEQPDGRLVSSLGLERPESVAKSLIHRGSRILKRQNSKFSLASTLALEEEQDVEKTKYRFEVVELFQRGSRGRSRDSTLAGMLA